MAKENSFSITRITMTPKTARNFCIIGAIVLTLVLAIGAVCWTEEGGNMFGNRTSGGGGSSSAADMVIDAVDDATVAEGESEDASDEESADDTADTIVETAWSSVTARFAASDPRQAI